MIKLYTEFHPNWHGLVIFDETGYAAIVINRKKHRLISTSERLKRILNHVYHQVGRNMEYTPTALEEITNIKEYLHVAIEKFEEM